MRRHEPLHDAKSLAHTRHSQSKFLECIAHIPFLADLPTEELTQLELLADDGFCFRFRAQKLRDLGKHFF